MFRRTFIALAGAVGILGTTQAKTSTISRDSSQYDVYPDDTDATIQAALDDMSVVEAAPGDYQYGRDLTVPDGTTLRGAGEHQTVFHADGPYRFTNDGRPTENVTFERLTVDKHGYGSWAIHFSNPHDVTVRDVTVRNQGDAGDDAKVTVGLRCNKSETAGNVLVENVTVVDGSVVGIDCGGSGGSGGGDWTVRDCRIEGFTPVHWFHHGISIESLDDATVTNCHVDGKDVNLIGINANATTHSRVVDNIVRNCRSGVHVANGPAHAVDVADNTIHDVYTGILVQASGDVVVNDVEVRENTVRDCYYGIRQKSGHCDVLDNLVTEWGKRGITIAHPSQRERVVGNTTRDGNLDEPAMRFGGAADSIAGDPSHAAVVADNDCDSYIATDRLAVFRDNDIRGAAWSGGPSIQPFTDPLLVEGNATAGDYGDPEHDGDNWEVY